MHRVLGSTWIAALLACSTSGEPARPDTMTDAMTDAIADTSRLPVDGELAVLSLNLHCLHTTGTRYASNAARFAAIAATVATERVDVILAQEVCASATEDGRAGLRTALDAATGDTWSVIEMYAHRAWAGTPDEADEYVALFTRAPATAPTRIVHGAQAGLRRVAVGASVTSSLVTAAGAPVAVRVYAAHLDHADAITREAQARELAAVAMVDADDPGLAIGLDGGDLALPVIVGGDFNARFGDAAPQALLTFGFADAARGAGTTRIDHVLAHRSAPLRTAHATELFVGADAVSDHPGVLVRFVPAAATGVRLTRITATGDQTRPLAVRGDAGPLRWTIGWPAIPRGPANTLVTSELPAGAFAYKFLRDDVDWQIGDNAVGEGQADNTTQPVFP